MRQGCLTPPPKRADPHYLSTAHRKWRQQVGDRAGWRCEAPGCGETEGRMIADHVEERRDNGAELDLTNGKLLCAACHNRKTQDARRRRMEGGV